MPVPRKGLQDIWTLSGRIVSDASLPHKAFMRLASLEMEKLRRGKERQSAIARVKNIDARFEEIRAQKNDLLQGLGMTEGTKPNGAPAPKPRPAAEKRGFRIKY